MNKTIRNLAIAALFIFPGISGFPQEVQQEEIPAVQPRFGFCAGGLTGYGLFAA